ncbi:methionine aminopeptidase 1D, mitochondrial isoform X1 [Boleophthalmus pectinirostris]|uniref:methionine aminopeptidase 1D, mitochondrial isoform X1 n=1 Tax=Boleophthalmus pectinirostris TaxID=150288 RepID=UPI00242EE32A|nr:methionine aminopeptidase 1D, mitochondrial isoform X1 [Boleophthalmus pectinirostris]
MAAHCSAGLTRGLGGFLRGVCGFKVCGPQTAPLSQQSRCFFWKKWKSQSHSVVRPETVRPAYPVPKHIERPDYVGTGVVPEWPDYIEIKNQEQIEGLARACQLARHVLLLAGQGLQVGMTTDEIDFIVHQETIKYDAYPSPLKYGGFPKSVCTSVNNVVCHGIPDSRKLKNGDIINIDVTVYLDGYHGDTSETFLIGEVDEIAQKLVETARRCRDEAIAACHPGAPLCVIGNTISKIAHASGFQVCPYFIGHGIGSSFHCHPEIWHHANDNDMTMDEGMAFTIEPILMEGSSEFRILKDKWTAVSVDDKRSAQFEHTVVITANGVDILTKLPEEDNA